MIDAFLEEAQPYAQHFVPGLANIIFRALREPRFPKRRDAQVNFLADSLAGFGIVAPRSSRGLKEGGFSGVGREVARAEQQLADPMLSRISGFPAR